VVAVTVLVVSGEEEHDLRVLWNLHFAVSAAATPNWHATLSKIFVVFAGVAELACVDHARFQHGHHRVSGRCCGSGSCGVPRPSLGGYVTGTGATRGVPTAGGR
jgi:hypothetical protein